MYQHRCIDQIGRPMARRTDAHTASYRFCLVVFMVGPPHLPSSFLQKEAAPEFILHATFDSQTSIRIPSGSFATFNCRLGRSRIK